MLDCRAAPRAGLVSFALLALACARREPTPAWEAPASRPVRRAAAPDRGFIGVVVAGEVVEVEPRIEGRLQEIFVAAGDHVAAGAPIARLDAEGSLQELAAARAALYEAARRHERRRKLARIRRDAVTAEEMDAARRELRQERARVARLRAASAEATVRAPFEGTVAERYLPPGALCGPGRAVVRLVGRGEARVRFAVPEERAVGLALGGPVEVRLGGRRLRGRVVAVSPEVDAASRMVFAEASLEASQRLSTGLIARVFGSAKRETP